MLSSLLPTAVGFLMLPIYSRYLNPSDYGIIGLIISFQTFLPLLFTFQFQNTIQRFYFDYKNNSDELKQFISSILIFVFCISFIVLVTILSFLNEILSLVYSNALAYKEYFMIGVITSFFVVYKSLFMNLIRVQQKAILFFIVNIILFCVSLVINIFEVIIYKRGAYGVLESSLITSVISSLTYLFFVREYIKFKFCFRKIKSTLSYISPLIPHSFFGLIFMYSDRFILERNVSIEDFGLFIFGAKISILGKHFVMEFNNAYSPYFNSIAVESKLKAINKTQEVSCIVIYLISLFICILSSFIEVIVSFLFDYKYHDCAMYIPILLLGYFYQAHYIFSVIGIFFEKRTMIVLVITFISSIIGFVLNFYFIPIYGVIFACSTFVLSYLLMFVLSYNFSKNIFFTNFFNFKILIINTYTVLYVIFISCDRYFNLFENNIYFIKIIFILFILIFGFCFNLFYFNPFKSIFSKFK